MARESLIIVPTYNEAENLGPLLSRLGETAPDADVLVVDDNSPDGTGNVARNYARHDERIHLLERPGKQGLAAAYIAGFRWGLEKGYGRLLEMDADFSHDPEMAPRLLKALDGADLAIGSRYMAGGGTRGWSKSREAISRGGNTYARLVLGGLPYTDLTGGFNAWRRSTLEKIRFETLRCRGYAFQVELKYRAHRAGLKIRELPITFGDRRFGESKMSSRIVFEAALMVFKMRRSPAP